MIARETNAVRKIVYTMQRFKELGSCGTAFPSGLKMKKILRHNKARDILSLKKSIIVPVFIFFYFKHKHWISYPVSLSVLFQDDGFYLDSTLLNDINRTPESFWRRLLTTRPFAGRTNPLVEHPTR